MRFLERRSISVPYRGFLYQDGREFPEVIEVTIAITKRPEQLV